VTGSGRPGEVIARFEQDRIWSSAVAASGFVNCVGVAADLGGGIARQSREALAEVDRCLALAGARRQDIVQAMIWLADIGDLESFNEAWAGWADRLHLPARACVEAKLGDPRMLVEVWVLAVKR
jgi:enamine deaminase RidA (YjgF/YER057c/UK114 family)